MTDETEAIKETAKATQEVAKTTSNAIDAGRELGGFFSKFITGPLEESSGILYDRLRYIRWERQKRLMLRAQEFIKQQGLPSPDKPIPLKNAIPLLEYATLEEDDNLQDIWARLLVNGTNSSTGVEIERSFIEILGQISSLEAQILQAIYSLPYEQTRLNGVYTEHLPEYATIVDDKTKENLSEPTDKVKIALANLVRLGCLKFPATWGGGEIYTQINPTLIGNKLVSACTLK